MNVHLLLGVLKTGFLFFRLTPIQEVPTNTRMSAARMKRIYVDSRGRKKLWPISKMLSAQWLTRASSRTREGRWFLENDFQSTLAPM